MIEKYLKKSIAGALTLATIFNGCATNISANEVNSNKPSRIKKCLKYIVPVGLVGTTLLGMVALEKINDKEIKDDEETKKSKYQELLRNLESNSDCSEYFDRIADYLENYLGNMAEQENVPTAGGHVYKFHNFGRNIDNNKRIFKNYLQQNAIIIFYEKIFNNPDSSIEYNVSNFLLITVLQKLYLNQIRISREANEWSAIENQVISAIQKYYAERGRTCRKKVKDNVRKFFAAVKKV